MNQFWNRKISKSENLRNFKIWMISLRRSKITSKSQNFKIWESGRFSIYDNIEYPCLLQNAHLKSFTHLIYIIFFKIWVISLRRNKITSKSQIFKIWESGRFSIYDIIEYPCILQNTHLKSFLHLICSKIWINFYIFKKNNNCGVY